MIPKNKGLLFICCLGDLPMVAFQIKQEKAQGLPSTWVFGLPETLWHQREEKEHVLMT